MIVTKFGGSSVASSEQFKKVKHIIESNPDRQIVISSAVGKKNSEDNKVTDLLYLLFAHIQYSVSFEHLYKVLVEKFVNIKEELGLSYDIEAELEKLHKELKKGISQDYLVSRGEYLTSLLMAEYLGFTFVDAKDVMRFSYNGKLDMEESERAIRQKYAQYGKMVIPGFYGALPDGSVRVMSRGGSDITGSIVAKALDAEVYENWTDVSGILMADPRIIDNPKWIEVITYSELRELSYMGANVLHEDAIFPVKEANIPIMIKNTNAPNDPGTKIVDIVENEPKSQKITGISGKRDFTVFTMYRHNSSNEIGILRKALEVFEKYNVSVEHVPSGIDNFSIVVATSSIERCMYDIASELKQVCQTDSIKITGNISLIAVVGRNMASQCGMSGRVFKTLGDHDINIRMIAQGSDEINIIVGVENEDFKKAIQVIYNEFS